MALPTLNYTTGPCTLGDDAINPAAGVSGTLAYNGCIFSPLFETKVSGKCVEDNANRTVKLMEYSITADGYVTFAAGVATGIGPTMLTLYTLLTQQSKSLTYKGRGLDIVTGGGTDVAWGPVPEVLEFQPLGGGLSAKVQWRVTVRIPPPAIANVSGSAGLLQLNYETSIRYAASGYSSFTIKGTMEIPLNRVWTKNGVLTRTVDKYRALLETRILDGIDLGRFHLTNREFNISRDKRSLEFNVAGEEKPYMDLPPDCTLARGSYSVHPAKQGAGLAQWICSLQATYTVAASAPRTRAEFAFKGLMYLRMQQTPLLPSINGNDGRPLPIKPGQPQKVLSRKPILINFSMNEGLYLDSDTVSFSATWRLMCSFSQIILASGMWRKVPEGLNGLTSDRRQDTNLWAITMQASRTPTKDDPTTSIVGAYSWLPNTLDPSLDIIVDLGSGV